MALLLEHPGAASLPCEECQKWIYDIKTGNPIMRAGKKQKRGKNQETPCRTCPKKSPENAKRLELTRANIATLQLYWRNRATLGCLSDAERNDEWLQRNFSIIDSTFRGWEMEQSTAVATMMLEGMARNG